MIATVTSNQDRVNKTRERLMELKSQGFRYIVTTDDGDTWIGSHENGLEIDELVESCFMGEVLVAVA